jgi:hypothetical protein
VPVAGFEDFDRYVEENNVPLDDDGEAFARWIADRTGCPAPRFEKPQPGDELILPDREQRELDGVPSFLAPRDDAEDETSAYGTT